MKTSRRNFLSGVIASGSMLSLCPAILSQETKSDKLNVGLIGAGTAGRSIMEACRRVRGVRFKAVFDIWDVSRQYCKHYLGKFGHDVNIYEDYRDMLDKERGLDAVIVATPTFLHAEHAIACLDAGLHVYLARELSNSVEKANRIMMSAGKSVKFLQVGLFRRSEPIYRLALELITKDKVCGRITNCHAQWNRSHCDRPGWPEKFTIPREILKKHGYESMEQFRAWDHCVSPTADMGSDQIDVVSWYLGTNPANVIGTGSGDYFEGMDWFSDIMAIYEYYRSHGGKRGSVRCFYQSLSSSDYGGYFERFMGDEGTVTVSTKTSKCSYQSGVGGDRPDWLEKVLKAQPENTEEVPLIDVLRGNARTAEAIKEWEANPMWCMQPHLENFFDAIRRNDKKALACPPEVAYPTAVSVIKMREAVSLARKVVFKDDDFRV